MRQRQHAISLTLGLLAILLGPRATLGIIRGPDFNLDTCTIEALTTHCQLVFIARLDAVSTRFGAPEITVHRIEIVKSPGFDLPLELSLPLHSGDEFSHPTPALGSQILLFVFVQHPDNARLRWYWAEDFVLLDHADALTPSGNHPRDLTLRPIADGQGVLAIVRDEVAQPHPPTGVKFFSSFPLQLGIFPDDPRLLDAARAWARSSDVEARILAPEAFKAYPDPQDTPALRAILQDSHHYGYPGDLSPWAVVGYPVRKNAAEALKARGAAFEMPVLSEPWKDLYKPIPWIRLAAMLLTAPLLAAWFLRRRRVRKGLTPHGIPGILWQCIKLSCLWMAFVSATLWGRSYVTFDECTYASNSNLLNLDSICGVLILETSGAWPKGATTSAVHLAITPRRTDPTLLSYAYTRSDIGIEDLGVGLIDLYSGNYYQEKRWMEWTAAPAEVRLSMNSFENSQETYYPGYRITCGYSFLVAFFLVLPLGTLAFTSGRKAILTHRRRLRQSRGLCQMCGYDMRSHGPGARCPECGAVFQPAEPTRAVV